MFSDKVRGPLVRQGDNRLNHRLQLHIRTAFWKILILLSIPESAVFTVLYMPNS